MRNRKLLFSMIAGFFMSGTVIATSETSFTSNQTYYPKENASVIEGASDFENTASTYMPSAKSAKSTSNLIPMGPDNMAGRIRAIVIDEHATGNATVLYAGGVTGGLYKSENGGKSWKSVPYIGDEGKEIFLPISCMIQLPNGDLLIGTGEGLLKSTLNAKGLKGPMGRGLFRFNRNNATFTVIAETAPVSYSAMNTDFDWAYINRIACVENDSKVYVYAATNTGLFRWVIENETSWNNAPQKIYSQSVQDIDIAQTQYAGYFTSKQKVYKINDVRSSSVTPAIISAESPFDTNASRIEIAIAPSNENYVYACVAAANGGLDGIYVMVDEQPWKRISTSTVSPFLSNNGWFSNSISVSTHNPNLIYVGGTDIWIGNKYEGNSFYSWTYSSSSNASTTSPSYVHANIHHFVMGTKDSSIYIATDGGVFKSGLIYDGIPIPGNGSSQGYSAINKGLTTTQFNSLDVCNDGGLLGGAVGNAVLYIASRSNSDITIPSLDSINRTAESVWYGDGAGVCASKFHQIAPSKKRGIIVSSQNAKIGRAYDNYNDYTNTQTWTIGNDFINSMFSTGPYVTPMILWETTTDTKVKDSITFTLTTPFILVRNGKDTLASSSDFKILSGDKLLVRSPAHMDYPFEYTFNHSFVISAEPTHTVKNPIQSRLFVGAGKSAIRNQVYMSTTPIDFRKIGSGMRWYNIADLAKSKAKALAISSDGDCLFIAAEDSTGTSTLIRVRKLATTDESIIGAFEPGSSYKETVTDTIVFGSNPYLARSISSLTMDPNNDNLIVTCAGISSDIANMYYIKNATTDNPVIEAKTVVNNRMPAHSALVEIKDGEVYVGTDNGIYVSYNITATQPTWTAFGDLTGVPVYAMKQQLDTLPRIKAAYYTGINSEEYRFGRTKYPYAIYFATYGKGIYMDNSHVSNFENEVGIKPINPMVVNTLKIYPNPATSYTNIELVIEETTNASIRVFDMSGREVYAKTLNKLSQGTYKEEINCQPLQKGVYIINVMMGSQMATSKLIVK